jgi:hypothetical protein
MPSYRHDPLAASFSSKERQTGMPSSLHGMGLPPHQKNTMVTKKSAWQISTWQRPL